MMTPHFAGELVPLADRIRYMRWLRVAIAVGAVLACTVPWPPSWEVMAPLLVVGGTYIGLSLGFEAMWRVRGRRGLQLFNALLIVDGLFLAWATTAIGGTVSPVTYLTLLHLVAVTLLASYRTGLKLALWHSLLLFVAARLVEAGWAPIDGSTVVHEPARLGIFVVAFWLVAITTAACSAGNERELRRRKVDLEALAEMARRLEQVSTPGTVGQVLVDSLVETFGFHRCALVAGLDARRLIASYGCVDGPFRGAGTRSVLASAERRRKTMLVTHLDAEGDSDLHALLPGARNLVVVPLIAADRPIGTLLAEHGPRRTARVERRVVTMAERFVSHAALGLRNAWLLQDVQELARVDQLTQVANRRVLEEVVEAELLRAARNESFFGLVMLDIDRFKILNDTHGHQVGDAVLHQVAQAIQSECRAVDTLARYGGEEFAIVLPGCTAREAAEAAERFRGAVAGMPLATPVTASFGVAMFPSHGEDLASLVGAADAALYAAKDGGRNRVVVAETVASAVEA